MEYARNLIINAGFKRVDDVRNSIHKLKYKTINIRLFLLKTLTIIKKVVGYIVNVIKNNKFISLTLSILVLLIAMDFILIDSFMKLLLTL